MVIPGYTVGSLRIEPGLVLAPMSGVTSRPFRRLVKALNPGAIGLLMTEFVSVEAMTRKVARSIEMMRFHQEERPLGIQIFGFDPARMRDAAVMVEQAGADLVDINCGCPAPKVVRKGGGCELMRQPDHLKTILKQVRPAVQIPLTLKMRSGYEAANRNCVEIARIAEGEGVQALAVHGRTRAQAYRGEADWLIIRQVAAAVKIPVVGSGDVVDVPSAQARLCGESDVLQVSGLMIGRGALPNPFIFRDIVAGAKTDLKGDPHLVISVLSRYAQLLEEDFAPKVSIGRMKQLVSQMARGHAWRAPLLLAKSFAEQRAIIEGLMRPPMSSEN